MKSFRKMLLLLLVLLLIPMLAACGEDDKDADEKDSGGFSITKGENSAEGVVKTYVKYSEELEEATNELDSTCLMLSNKKALKKLDIDRADDSDVDDYKWKITKSKEYDGDSDVTAGVKAYVRKYGGDDDAVEKVALVQVTVTYTVSEDDDDDDDDDDDSLTKEYFFTAVKIGGTWYLANDNARREDSFKDAEEYWEDRA